MNKEILVVDQEESFSTLVREIFVKEGFEVTIATTPDDAFQKLSRKPVPIVICDVRQLGNENSTLLNRVREKKISSVFILTSGIVNVGEAVKAYKDGAFEYVYKTVEIEELKEIVRRAFIQAKDLHESVIKMALPSDSNPLPKIMVGQSRGMVRIFREVAKASLVKSNVLILGESGTGKELVARAIHENSSRKNAQFVAVNCGAVTETLLEAELFGYLKGAFTGAIADRTGYFEEANQGTLFLDEIGDISPAFQVKLLRAIQEGEIRPVGATRTRRVDVRVIAATHRDLNKMIEEEKFRKDLFYRLNVMKIEIPSLRERMEDLPALVEHFLLFYSQQMNRPMPVIPSETLEMLKNYPWPGNIRELENAIERALSIGDGMTLQNSDFPEQIQLVRVLESGELALPQAHSPEGRRLVDVEKCHIAHILKEVNFNKSQAAMILGIDRATLYRKAQRYGIRLEKES